MIFANCSSLASVPTLGTTTFADFLRGTSATIAATAPKPKSGGSRKYAGTDVFRKFSIWLRISLNLMTSVENYVYRDFLHETVSEYTSELR
jgi:hypothetical protein